MKDNKSMFADNNEARAMQKLIHDTNRGFSLTNGAACLLEKSLKKSGLYDKLSIGELSLLSRLKKLDEIKKPIDEYYVKWQKNFELNQ